MTFGGDYFWSDADAYYQNLDRIFAYINERSD